MKVVGPYFNSKIEVGEGDVFCLSIENAACFRHVVEDIHGQVGGGDGTLVLSRDNAPIPFSKNAEVLEDFAPFTLNSKSMLSRLSSALERTALDAEHYIETAQLVASIEKYICELSFSLPFRVECSKLGIGSLIKAATVRIAEDHQNTVEAVVAYMSAVVDLDKPKLFVAVNMRAYFSDAELAAFVTEVRSHGLRVLLLENRHRPLPPGVRSLIVDEDLCEI